MTVEELHKEKIKFFSESNYPFKSGSYEYSFPEPAAKIFEINKKTNNFSFINLNISKRFYVNFEKPIFQNKGKINNYLSTSFFFYWVFFFCRSIFI